MALQKIALYTPPSVSIANEVSQFLICVKCSCVQEIAIDQRRIPMNAISLSLDKPSIGLSAVCAFHCLMLQVSPGNAAVSAIRQSV